MKKPGVKTIKRIIALMLFIGGIVLLCIFGKNKLEEQKSHKIITTNYISYDLARAVTGDSSQIAMLLKPGVETHDFEPSPQDIISIKESELFVYVGGESDEWVKNLLGNNEIENGKSLRLMNLINLKVESTRGIIQFNRKDNSTIEYDEHIWTSPKNTIKLVEGIRDKLSEIHPENKEKYQENAKKYTDELSKIDQEIRFITKVPEKKELIFGDRFPFKYLTDEYDLSYQAAFLGCSDQTEASSSTIAELIKKAKESKTEVILKIEMTSDKLAKTIADEVGAEVLVLNAAHNISQEDFDNGKTYLDIMKENIEVLRRALKAS